MVVIEVVGEVLPADAKTLVLSARSLALGQVRYAFNEPAKPLGTRGIASRRLACSKPVNPQQTFVQILKSVFGKISRHRNLLKKSSELRK